MASNEPRSAKNPRGKESSTDQHWRERWGFKTFAYYRKIGTLRKPNGWDTLKHMDKKLIAKVMGELGKRTSKA
jgi:hypothetical protein